MDNLKVNGERVLVQVENPATKTAGGIDIPEDLQKSKLAGVVIRFGKRTARLNQGDLVIFGDYVPVDHELLACPDPNYHYVIVEMKDIYLIIEPDTIQPVGATEEITNNTEHELVN